VSFHGIVTDLEMASCPCQSYAYIKIYILPLRALGLLVRIL